MRLLFVCAFLNEQGGFETEVEGRARLALDAGHDVALFTPHIVRRDATIRANLSPVVSLMRGQEVWRRTAGGRGMLLAARLRHFAATGRRASAAEEGGLAKSRIPHSFYAHFWQGEGRQVLSRFDMVDLFGKPKTFVVAGGRQAKAMGKKVIYEEVAEVTAEYAAQPEHQSFVSASNLCDCVVAYCMQQVTDIRRYFRYDGEAVIVEQWAYGDEERLLRLRVRERGATGDYVTLVSLCRLGAEKGLDTLLVGFAEARKEVGNLRLRIAGQGALEEALRKQARELAVAEFVDFVGYVPDKVDFYASIDVFLIASREEGGPITGVEAMASGLPIVSTPVGAMPERLKDEVDGLFFPVDSVEGLSSAIVRLSRDPVLRRSLGLAARRRYRLRNHSGLCTARMLAVWESLGRT